MEATVPDFVEALLACADRTRLRILHLLLSERELCVYDLVDVTGASQPKISRHLACLRRCGLVTTRKDGLWVYYRISPEMPLPMSILVESLDRIFAVLSDLEMDRRALAETLERRSLPDRRYTALEPVHQVRRESPSFPEPAYSQRPPDQAEDLEIELL